VNEEFQYSVFKIHQDKYRNDSIRSQTHKKVTYSQPAILKKSSK